MTLQKHHRYVNLTLSPLQLYNSFASSFFGVISVIVAILYLYFELHLTCWLKIWFLFESLPKKLFLVRYSHEGNSVGGSYCSYLVSMTLFNSDFRLSLVDWPSVKTVRLHCTATLHNIHKHTLLNKMHSVAIVFNYRPMSQKSSKMTHFTYVLTALWHILNLRLLSTSSWAATITSSCPDADW